LAPVWNAQTAILTSATIPQSLPNRLGLAVDNETRLEVESPFDYEANALLYLADDLPDPDAPDRNRKLHARIRQLVQYSDGSALVLFTSRKAMRDAVDELRGALDDITVLSQDDMGKKALLDAFKTDIRSCLFATRSFFQGVDVPGDALRLVILDKVPFPMRTDPLLEARRDLLGQSAFMQIDVPIAAATLAQAAGRLIRSATDHGVVAILDSRLAKRRYKNAVLEGVAHFPETSQLDDVKSFFHRR
jgi:ATP-dependent DNA helicase DinG